MSIKNRIDDFINDKEYKITICKNKVNIINYTEIIDFSPHEITLKSPQGITTVEGENLTITKLLENELLIEGTIKSVSP